MPLIFTAHLRVVDTAKTKVRELLVEQVADWRRRTRKVA